MESELEGHNLYLEKGDKEESMKKKVLRNVCRRKYDEKEEKK